MESNNINYKAINDAYKNAHIALQSISNLLPSVDNKEIISELKFEYDGYEKIIGEISSYMANNGIERKDINPMKKLSMWSAIKMKTMMNNSKNQVAEMMIKGTVTGITELQAMINEKDNYNPEVTSLLKKLLQLEEDYQERLKKFL